MFLLFCFKRVGFPIHPEIFYIFERCERCRIRTRDLWPKVWCTNNEPPHIKCFKLFFYMINTCMQAFVMEIILKFPKLISALYSTSQSV